MKARCVLLNLLQVLLRINLRLAARTVCTSILLVQWHKSHPRTSNSMFSRTSTTTRATTRSCPAANWTSSSPAATCCKSCASKTTTGGRRSAPTRRPRQTPRLMPASCPVPPAASRRCIINVSSPLRTLASQAASGSTAASSSPNASAPRTPSHPSVH